VQYLLITCFSEAMQDAVKDCRCEVIQWSTGAQITDVDRLTATVRLQSKPAHHLTIVCCGPADQRRRLFFYQVTLHGYCPSMLTSTFWPRPIFAGKTAEVLGRLATLPSTQKKPQLYAHALGGSLSSSSSSSFIM